MYALFLPPPRRRLTLLSTQDASRPFCLETQRFVDIDVPISSGRDVGADAPRILGKFEDEYVAGELDVYYVELFTPLYDFMYQARSGDVENLKTPCFDSMVSDPQLCLRMLGEALCYSESPRILDTTAWYDTDDEEHATGMVFTFLWNAAPWLRHMPATHAAMDLPEHTLVFSSPPGDLFEIHAMFRNEMGAIYVKALEAWWACADGTSQ